ncbi:hypothetical protein MNBD_GAMMA01-1080 [hydrothermal vent metagenome]|uniref:Uncharacterized protein n=1 Tax=hydrothermal vent metagenome TaxID=652676 RepID=A0A3B0UQY9_9ZZZZ
MMSNGDIIKQGPLSNINIKQALSKDSHDLYDILKTKK